MGRGDDDKNAEIKQELTMRSKLSRCWMAALSSKICLHKDTHTHGGKAQRTPISHSQQASHSQQHTPTYACRHRA